MLFYSSVTANKVYSQLVGTPIGMILTSTIRASCWDFISLHFMYPKFFPIGERNGQKTHKMKVKVAKK